MNPTTEIIIVYTIIAAASLYMAKRIYKLFKSPTCGSGCAGCGTNTKSQPPKPKITTLTQLTINSQKSQH